MRAIVPPGLGRTTPPSARLARVILGRFGTLKVSPPIFGTHFGTVKLNLPTELFQASDMAFRTATNGAAIDLIMFLTALTALLQEFLNEFAALSV